MKQSLKHLKGRAIVTYLGAIAMLGASALSIDIAFGFMSNMQAYLRIQPANGTSVNAIATNGAPTPLAAPESSSDNKPHDFARR